MKKLKKDNTNKVILALVILLLATGLFNFVYWLALKPLETRIFEARFSVGSNIGMDLNKTSLTFGKVVPGGTARRGLKIDNTYDFPVEIKISASKNIADYIHADINSTIIPPLTLAEIPFVLTVPWYMEFGDYSGKVLVKIYKAK